MQNFARLLSFVTFLLSVGFLAQALPTTHTGNGIAVRDYNTPSGYNSGNGYNSGSGYDGGSGYSKEAAPANKHSDPTPNIDLLALVTKLNNDVEPLCKELEAAVDVKVAADIVDKIVALVKELVAACVNVKLDLSVDIKAQIAAKVVACISVIVKALAAVCVKLGVDVCLSLIAKIDVCIHHLLSTLGACVDGLLKVIIGLCLNLDVAVLAALKLCNLKLVVNILALKIVAAVAI
ncbi:hypothetical protein FRC11_004699 [Ceratobasidium sp. 423]|nr:hypothetical protein FRC11_004699 [Ceratobasidium sp. 423]